MTISAYEDLMIENVSHKSFYFFSYQEQKTFIQLTSQIIIYFEPSSYAMRLFRWMFAVFLKKLNRFLYGLYFGL
jgi:hypothetical protein